MLPTTCDHRPVERFFGGHGGEGRTGEGEGLAMPLSWTPTSGLDAQQGGVPVSASKTEGSSREFDRNYLQ